MEHHFSHTLPGSKRARQAFLSLTVVLALCILGYIVSGIFWDEYTYPAYSLRYHVNVVAGWPASLQGWSLWLGIAIIVIMPIMYFMQDWKNPSLGLTDEGLFINQQMIRNQLVPYSNISGFEKKSDSYIIKFKDNSTIYKKAGFFKPLVKSNLNSGNFSISQTHSGGDLDTFFEALNKKTG